MASNGYDGFMDRCEEQCDMCKSGELECSIKGSHITTLDVNKSVVSKLSDWDEKTLAD